MMTEAVVFRSMPAHRGWVVTRDERPIGHYKNQSIAEREMARIARSVANKGVQARAILYKRDGSVGSERSYTQLTVPWLRHPKAAAHQDRA
jgi:hypothetical protein